MDEDRGDKGDSGIPETWRSLNFGLRSAAAQTSRAVWLWLQCRSYYSCCVHRMAFSLIVTPTPSMRLERTPKAFASRATRSAFRFCVRSALSLRSHVRSRCPSLSSDSLMMHTERYGGGLFSPEVNGSPSPAPLPFAEWPNESHLSWKQFTQGTSDVFSCRFNGRAAC